MNWAFFFFSLPMPSYIVGGGTSSATKPSWRPGRRSLRRCSSTTWRRRRARGWRWRTASRRWWLRCWGSSTPGGRRPAWKPWPATCWRQPTSKNFLSKQHLFYCMQLLQDTVSYPKMAKKRYCKILNRAIKTSLLQDTLFFLQIYPRYRAIKKTFIGRYLPFSVSVACDSLQLRIIS